MTLAELLAHTKESFAGRSDEPASFLLLKGRTGEWQEVQTRPITGVRLGDDEVLVETDELPREGALPAQLTIAELLDSLRALEADHSDRPVEACEAEVDIGKGVRVRIDYGVIGSGQNELDGTCLLIGHLGDISE